MSTLQKNKWPLLFTGASIILFIIFFLIPALLGLYYSLTDYKGFATANFIGLANYQELFQDASFYKALFRTFRYVIILVPSIYVVSLAVALMLNSQLAKGKFFAKIIFSYHGPSLGSSLGLSGNGCLVKTLALSTLF